MGDQPATYTGQHKHRIKVCVHACTHTHNAFSGDQTHDPNVQVGEDGSCLRPRGYCDRWFRQLQMQIMRDTFLQASTVTLFYNQKLHFLLMVVGSI
jgi:hypothetical protein